VSRATEWKAKGRETGLAEAVELELPSGAKIRALRPDLMQLAAWNVLPMGLAGAVVGEGEAQLPTVEKTLEVITAGRDLLVYCCVEPRISLTPGEDEIHPRDIPKEDWTFILRWALRVEEARALEGFRGGRPDAGSGGDGEVLQPTTF
jgi:hypothetical protein